MTTMAYNYLLFAVLALCFSSAKSYNILLLPVNMGSRFTYFGELGQALARNGNNVTMVFGEKMKIPNDLLASGINFQYYRMKNDLVTKSKALPNMILEASMSKSFLGTLKSMQKFMQESESEAEQMFHDAQFMRKIEGTKFDFAVVDLLYPMSLLTYKLNIPYAVMSIDYFWWTYRLPMNPSYVPSAVAWYGDDMTFAERSINVFLYIITTPLFFGDLHTEKITRYAPNRPTATFNDLQARPSLVLRLQNLAMDYPRPSPPNVINVGGLMARPAKTLNPHLDSFVQGASHGMIVVSFGSWFEELPSEVADKFIEAFAQVPQRVVWKFSPSASQRSSLSPNVKVMSWLPQNDLLGHKNTRLFITHCGIGGATEALYHGVPVLAVPLALDQMSNANKAMRKGLGEVIDIGGFTSTEVIDKINKIISGPHKENAKQSSAILKDFPTGRETAVFWIEHVIKFGDKHLKLKSFDLPWYQYILLDVFLFWTSLFITLIALLIKLLKHTARLISLRIGNQKYPL